MKNEVLIEFRRCKHIINTQWLGRIYKKLSNKHKIDCRKEREIGRASCRERV